MDHGHACIRNKISLLDLVLDLSIRSHKICGDKYSVQTKSSGDDTRGQSWRLIETHCKETMRNGVFSLHTVPRTLKPLFFVAFLTPDGDIIGSLLEKVYGCLWYHSGVELFIRLIRYGERNPSGLCITKKISLPWLCGFFPFSFFPFFKQESSKPFPLTPDSTQFY